jgi:hypothetical protein
MSGPYRPPPHYSSSYHSNYPPHYAQEQMNYRHQSRLPTPEASRSSYELFDEDDRDYDSPSEYERSKRRGYAHDYSIAQSRRDSHHAVPNSPPYDEQQPTRPRLPPLRTVSDYANTAVCTANLCPTIGIGRQHPRYPEYADIERCSVAAVALRTDSTSGYIQTAFVVSE